MPNLAPHPASDQREDHAKPLPVRPALCTHVMPSGATCGSPAVSGTPLCYHHSAVKTALAKAGSASSIPFVFPEDRAALQINYFLLLQAFTAGRIDLRSFNSMQRLLRSMAANLGKKPLAEDHANVTETPATAHSSEAFAPVKEMKKPAATAKAPCEKSGEDKPQNSHFKPAAQNPAHPKSSATRPLPSLEEIAAQVAAQHKPLGSECFVISSNQPRLSDTLIGPPLSR